MDDVTLAKALKQMGTMMSTLADAIEANATAKTVKVEAVPANPERAELESLRAELKDTKPVKVKKVRRPKARKVSFIPEGCNDKLRYYLNRIPKHKWLKDTRTQTLIGSLAEKANDGHKWSARLIRHLSLGYMWTQKQLTVAQNITGYRAFNPDEYAGMIADREAWLKVA